MNLQHPLHSWFRYFKQIVFQIFVSSHYNWNGSSKTLGSWVQILIKVRMSFCVYSVFMLPCLGSRLLTGWSLIQGVIPTVYKTHNFIMNSEWARVIEHNLSKQKRKTEIEQIERSVWNYNLLQQSKLSFSSPAFPPAKEAASYKLAATN
jgi:hypothetical protein